MRAARALVYSLVMKELWQRYRWKLGGVLLGLSCLPWVAAAMVPFVGLSAATSTAAVAGLLILAEVLFLLSVVAAGPKLWQDVKRKTKTYFAGKRR